MQDVFFELGTEELPSGLVAKLAKELLHHVLKAFDDAQLSYSQVNDYATPRRIAFKIASVPDQLPKREIYRRGPSEKAGMDSEGKPSGALLGFARSCGVDISLLKLVSQEKGAWWEYSYEEPGQMTTQFISDVIRGALQALTIPKPMRWGSGAASFARPVHWAVLLYGDVCIQSEFLGVQSDRLSYGHRFMNPDVIHLENSSQYTEKLKEAHVIVDFSERRAQIIRQIETLAGKQQWVIPIPEHLINEITSIVEWPVVMAGTFDEVFLTIPEPVLITSMQQHQKCLPVYNANGQLQPFFVIVANLVSNNPDSVRLGNEKVMRARLSDAMFFFEQDRQQPLMHYAAMTEKVIFEDRLGTLAAKTERVSHLAMYIANQFHLNQEHVLRAAKLSKCDLMTGMVGEFPELQGVIGQIYARADGESSELADALYEQYLPRYSGDNLPKTDIGYVLSLAERLDTLVGIFAIGLKPSGEKDPYKLRRHALAVVRLLLQKPNQLDIEKLLKEATGSYRFLSIKESLISDVKQFIIERMQSYYLQQDVSIERLNAALQVQPDSWYDLSLRLMSFEKFVKTDESEILHQAAKRVKQILLQTKAPVTTIDEKRLHETSEKELWEVVRKINDMVLESCKQQHYDEAFNALLKLALPLAHFFEQVFVMADDLELRKNRIGLLWHVQKLLHSVVIIGA